MYYIDFYPHYIILLRIHIKFEMKMWRLNWKKKYWKYSTHNYIL